MKRVVWGVISLLFLVLNSCVEQPTSVLDTQNMNADLSKASQYIPSTDITVQLRNDLNAGLDVKLPAGTFYLSESIIVLNYSGTIKGAGMDATVIENNPNIKFKATEDQLFPVGFEFAVFMNLYQLKGDVSIRNMSFRVTGDVPAEVHDNMFIGPRTTIDNAIVIDGANEEAPASGVTVTFENLKIKGELSNDPLSYNGKNLVYPLIVTGMDGVTAKPINTVMTGCVIENFGYPIEMYRKHGGTTLIQDNVINTGEGQPLVGHILIFRDVEDGVFRNNHISGNSTWGVNFWYGTDGWLIEKNTFENIITTAGSITCDAGIKNAIIRNNKFVNATSTGFNPAYPYGLIFIGSDGSGTIIKNNNYNRSGVPGWPSGAGCVLLWFDSSDYTLNDHNYPAGTTMCEQILDFGINNNMPSGWQGVCNPIPDNVRQNYLTKTLKATKKIRE